MPCSRAIRAASILPSIPRSPKPPGIRMPSASSIAAQDLLVVHASRSRPSRPRRRQPCSKPEWRSASTTDRYASSSCTYLPTRAIRTGACSCAAPAFSMKPFHDVEVGRRRLHAEVVEHEVVDALGLEVERDLVDQVDVARGDDRLHGQRREQRDLLADVVGQPALGAGDDHVGLDADAAQLVDRVLRRLRLELARVADVRHEREVDEHAPAPADVDRELPDRLEERQRLDVAHRAADLGDHDVDVLALAHELDAVLDLVRDVRDDLDGPAEVVAAALLADDRVVDRARGHVRRARRVRVGEPLVVARGRGRSPPRPRSRTPRRAGTATSCRDRR